MLYIYIIVMIVSSMDATKAIDTQVTLPMELYQAIARQAQANEHSISGEIVAVLTPLLTQPPTELEWEFAVWEAASDEDWLTIEATLASIDTN
jgi:hypothetical protein